ncbi:MAG: chromosome partitioning protein ParB, partial [Bacteroidetes bacterium HGW-Bacteroidetes-13]
QNLSVRQTETLVRNYHDKKSPKEDRSRNDEFLNKGISQFSDFFQTKVQVQIAKNGKGKIVIPFGSEEDFKRLKKLIKGDS